MVLKHILQLKTIFISIYWYEKDGHTMLINGGEGIITNQYIIFFYTFKHVNKIASLPSSQSFVWPPNTYRTTKLFSLTVKALYIKHSFPHSREWMFFIHTNLLSCPKRTVCYLIFIEFMLFSLPCLLLEEILIRLQVFTPTSPFVWRHH